MSRILSLVFVVAPLCAAIGVSAQTIVVSDPSALTWYKFRSGDSITSNSSTHSVLLSEGATQTSGSTFLTNFTPTTVGVGETITLSLGFTTGSTLNSTTSNSFRFGFFDAGSLLISANQNGNTNANLADDVGYMASYNFSGGAGSLYVRTTGATSLLSGTSSPWTGLAPSATGTYGAFAANTAYTLDFSLTRTDTGYNVASLLNGGAYSAYSLTKSDTTAGLPTTFSEAAIYVNGGSGAVSSLNVTSMSVKVGSAVPEPATYAVLLGSLTLALALWRRRRA